VLRLIPLFAACSFALTASVQSPTQVPAGARAAQGSTFLTGDVVDASTRSPIPFAVVTLKPDASDGDKPVAEQRVLSDASGRWVFRRLAPGSYKVTASAAGFLEGGLGQRQALGAAQSVIVGDRDAVRDLRVQLWRHAVISGTVRDEFGDPLVNTPLRAFRRVAGSLRAQFSDAGPAVRTDDLGNYRIAGLAPGAYIIASATMNMNSTTPSVVALYQQRLRDTPARAEAIRAETSASGVFAIPAPGMRIGNSIVQDGTLSGYDMMPPPPRAGERPRILARTYYPSTQSLSSAQSIAVRAGEDRTGVDFNLRYIPAVRVSGTVIGLAGPEALIGIDLLVAPDEGLPWNNGQYEMPLASAVSDGAGHFEFPAVVPGRYTLNVLKTARMTSPIEAFQQPTLSVRVPLVVGEADVDKVMLQLNAGVRITGTVAHDGQGKLSPSEMQRLAVTLAPVDGRGYPTHLPGRVREDGTFTTLEYPVGRYVVNVSGIPAGWALKSISSSGRDVLAGQLEITDVTAPPLTIVLTDRRTTLEGAVRNPKGADPDATVLVFPVDHAAWLQNGASPRVAREVRAGLDGGFSIGGLPAGDYLVVAVSDDLLIDWQSARSLAALGQHGSRASLQLGQPTRVNLETVSTVRR
jgi:hypothetical protein